MREGLHPNVEPLLRAVALVLWLLACITIVLSLAVWLGRGSPRLPISYVGGALGTSGVVMTGLVFATVAAYLTARAPRNPIGWIFIAIGVSMAVILPVNVVLADAVRQFRPMETPMIWVAWAVTSVQVPASGMALTLVLLLFPSGRPDWHRWRSVALIAVSGALLVSTGVALRPDGPIWYPTLPNPVAVPQGMRPTLGTLTQLGSLLLVTGLAAAEARLIWRLRHCDETQRRQLTWLVTGSTAMAATLAALFIGRYVVTVRDADGERLVFAAALGAVIFPITVAIACQREGLFGFKDLLGRSLVYLPLMALLAGLYSAAVALFQRLFVAFTGTTSDAAIVLATLLVAASLTPARHILETIVKRATEGKVSTPVAGAAMAGPAAGRPDDDLVAQLIQLQARVALLESRQVQPSPTPAETRTVPSSLVRAGRRAQPPGARHAHGRRDRRRTSADPIQGIPSMRRMGLAAPSAGAATMMAFLAPESEEGSAARSPV